MACVMGDNKQVIVLIASLIIEKHDCPRTNQVPRSLASALAYQPEIMLRVLVAVLRLDDVTVQIRLPGEGQIPHIVPGGIARTILRWRAGTF